MYFLILKNVMVNLFSYIATSLYDAPHHLSSYIPIASFSKPVWLLVIFCHILLLSFDPLHSDLWTNYLAYPCHSFWSTVRYWQVIFDIMTPYCDPFFQSGGLSFTLFVSSILENIGFNLEHVERVQASHTSLDKNL